MNWTHDRFAGQISFKITFGSSHFLQISEDSLVLDIWICSLLLCQMSPICQEANIHEKNNKKKKRGEDFYFALKQTYLAHKVASQKSTLDAGETHSATSYEPAQCLPVKQWREVVMRRCW